MSRNICDIHKQVEFSDSERLLIDDFMNQIGYKYRYDEYNPISLKYHKDFSTRYLFSKADDEWYFFSTSGDALEKGSYKCDQFEGLMSCMDDLVK